MRKPNKTKSKTDLRSVSLLVPKPTQDWLGTQVNGNVTNGTCHEVPNNTTSSQNGDIIEVDPQWCSINESNQTEDSELKPSQSKLRKLLSEHQVSTKHEANFS